MNRDTTGLEATNSTADAPLLDAIELMSRRAEQLAMSTSDPFVTDVAYQMLMHLALAEQKWKCVFDLVGPRAERSAGSRTVQS